MDMYDYAIQIEREGESYYRHLQKETNNQGLKKIFGWLADEEVKHRTTFERMQENRKINFKSTDIFENAQSVFNDIRKKKIFDFDTTQIDAYRKAQEIEKRSRDFYLVKAREEKNAASKKIIEKIADEELQHYFLLDNIVELVQRPKTWLENAEWHHLEQY